MSVGSGPGRLLAATYAVFAISSGARAGVQIAERFDDAPIAFSLSALAAAVYLVATVALLRDARRLALSAVVFELTGVLVVGTLSVLDREAFPDQTVWSGYGSGYAFVPLVLPVLGLLWLRRARGGAHGRPAHR